MAIVARPQSRPSFPHEARPDVLDARGLAGFTATVALLAIFSDAALGHGLVWENDPYWTYWVTKTFLIATVFGLGTAWLGIGVAQGAAITAVHTLVLTVYYWSLSPIGLPSHPEWLDLEHTWLTGLPIHFGVVYLGYLLALFAWTRRGLSPLVEPGRLAAEALLASLLLVLAAGALVSLALWDFPGATWFVVRLLVTFTFVLLWWGFVGRDLLAAALGALSLALVWAAYGHFLGPSGLPDTPLRLLAEDPPSATVEWLGYRDLWLVSLPLVAVVAFATLVAWSAFATDIRPTARQLVLSVVPLAVLVVPLAVAAVLVGGGGTEVRLSASGAAQVEEGPLLSGRFVDGRGSLALTGQDVGARVSPLPPHDRVSLNASLSAGARSFEVVADAPVVEDPLGRYTTWWGVGVDVWHHGRSGIGTDLVPPTRSEVAVFALGTVRADGEEVATGVPVHVMTTEGGLELLVGDPEVPVAGLPDGHLRAVWRSYEGGAEDDLRVAGYATGGAVLAGFLVLALLLVLRSREYGVRDRPRL